MDKSITFIEKKFDIHNRYWAEDDLWNQMFIRQVLAHFEKKLRVRGFVFLNDVYDELGLPMTKQGFISGWLYDENDKSILWDISEPNSEGEIKITFISRKDILDVLPEE